MLFLLSSMLGAMMSSSQNIVIVLLIIQSLSSEHSLYVKAKPNKPYVKGATKFMVRVLV